MSGRRRFSTPRIRADDEGELGHAGGVHVGAEGHDQRRVDGHLDRIVCRTCRHQGHRTDRLERKRVVLCERTAVRGLHVGGDRDRVQGAGLQQHLGQRRGLAIDGDGATRPVRRARLDDVERLPRHGVGIDVFTELDLDGRPRVHADSVIRRGRGGHGRRRRRNRAEAIAGFCAECIAGQVRNVLAYDDDPGLAWLKDPVLSAHLDRIWRHELGYRPDEGALAMGHPHKARADRVRIDGLAELDQDLGIERHVRRAIGRRRADHGRRRRVGHGRVGACRIRCRIRPGGVGGHHSVRGAGVGAAIELRRVGTRVALPVVTTGGGRRQERRGEKGERSAAV